MTDNRRTPALRRLLFASLPIAFFLTACAGAGERADGLDPSALPVNVRADYAIFAKRCSKCHSLARPLSLGAGRASGVDDDDFWELYVTRMRNQPGSGISLEDTVVILRFLHFYSRDYRATAPDPKAQDDSARAPQLAPESPDSGASPSGGAR